MTNLIKNIHKIEPFLSQEQLDKIEYGALLYRRHARIFFKIISVDTEKKELIVRIHQEKSPDDIYLDRDTLIQRATDWIKPFFEDYTIHIHPVPYQSAPPEVVTPEWIRAQMTKLHIGNKKLMADLGIAPAEISALINGHREMGIRTKAMFYYYFKAQEANHD